MLLFRVTLDGLYEIRNQIIAALQLIFNLRPGTFYGLIHGHEPVVGSLKKSVKGNHK